MAIVNVQNNGNAPSGLKFGDQVRTAGGLYTIVPNGTAGASFNPSSGYSSIKSNTSDIFTSASSVANTNNEQFIENVNKANAISADSSAKQYKFNSKEAQKNRDWQEYMSNTAHQREVEDLIKAGLNPVLSANAGAAVTSGATASGGSYSGQSANVDTNLLPAIMSLYSTILNNETNKDIARINADTALATTKINSATAKYNTELGTFVKNPGKAFGYGLISEASGKDAGVASKAFLDFVGMNSFKDFADPDNYGALGKWWKENKRK